MFFPVQTTNPEKADYLSVDTGRDSYKNGNNSQENIKSSSHFFAFFTSSPWPPYCGSFKTTLKSVNNRRAASSSASASVCEKLSLVYAQFSPPFECPVYR